MPKATLSFKLPEEKEEFDLALKAGKLHLVIYDLDQHLRGLTKYAPDTQPEQITEAYEQIREKLRQLIYELGIEL